MVDLHPPAPALMLAVFLKSSANLLELLDDYKNLRMFSIENGWSDFCGYVRVELGNTARVTAGGLGVSTDGC